MAYLLFIDESGQDRVHSPYEVLAGVAVEDSRIWPLIRALQDVEEACFGCRIRPSEMELKASRDELSTLADMVLALRFKTTLSTPVGDRLHWSFKVIDDLRYADEKLGIDLPT